MSPNFMYKDIMSYAEKRGKITRNKEGIVIKYEPHDPNLITEIIILTFFIGKFRAAEIYSLTKYGLIFNEVATCLGVLSVNP